MNFTREQIEGMIKIKQLLLNGGFDLYYPKEFSHPEEVIAVSANGSIIELRTGREGSIFLNYDNAINEHVQSFMERQTGLALNTSIFHGRKKLSDDINHSYSAE